MIFLTAPRGHINEERPLISPDDFSREGNPVFETVGKEAMNIQREEILSLSAPIFSLYPVSRRVSRAKLCPEFWLLSNNIASNFGFRRKIPCILVGKCCPKTSTFVREYKNVWIQAVKEAKFRGKQKFRPHIQVSSKKMANLSVH